jgi:type II/III secretion system protein
MIVARALLAGLVVAASVLATLAPWSAEPIGAQIPPHVKVLIEFRQSARASSDAVQGRGRVIITERSTRGRGGVDVGSSETRTRTSTGVFTIVRSGGEATMVVAQQVPFTEVAYYQDYATGRGYVAQGIVFRDVGTSLKVSATVLPGNQISLRLTPVISYFANDGSGTIELTRASTDLVVAHGQPVVIAGSTSESTSVTRRILGLSDSTSASETSIVLTATIQ